MILLLCMLMVVDCSPVIDVTALGELATLLDSVDCPDKAVEAREAIETIP